jgi:hypothetical protein
VSVASGMIDTSTLLRTVLGVSSRGEVASKDVRDAVARAINEQGIVAAARSFDLSRETLAKVAGGVAVTKGTLSQVREKLRRPEVER